MTLIHLINIVVAIALLIGSIAFYRHLKRKVEEADGVEDINTRGYDETNEIGTSIGTVGTEENEGVENRVS